MKTLKIRLKNKHAKVLEGLACEVNFVWNYCNDLCFKHFQRKRLFFSAFDIQKYLTGATKAGLNLHSQSLQAIAEELVTRRKQFKKVKLNWRVSSPESSKKSLGWIPFKASGIQYRSGQVKYAGYWFGLWDSYGLSEYIIKAGSFSQDARGRWYLNAVVAEIETTKNTATTAVGIDLGLKDCATTSEGEKLHGRWYRALEAKLAIAQRANKKDRARAIHAKIANRRKDALHKFSTELVKNNAAIFVGDVASAKLIKTKLAKSVLDAGWSSLKTMLEYKSQRAGIVFEVINESYTTQTCSCCRSISSSSPKGRAGLGIREWTCVACGTSHDRDINAAKNILALGHERLGGGIPVRRGGCQKSFSKSLPMLSGVSIEP